MARTAVQLTAEEIQAYRAGLSRRPVWDTSDLRARRARALQVARQVADSLREQFGATHVMLFGSLAHGCWYTHDSDIDIAVWGIPPSRFFEALGVAEALSGDFKVDLLPVEDCKPEWREVILSEAQPL